MSLASGSFVGVDHRNVKIHTASDVTVVYTPPTDSQGKFTVDGTTDPAARKMFTALSDETPPAEDNC
ncbi:hypothetical protein I316_02269 [Kwoniella heveanensis BCC8398]|uniref:Uncharacterized protein n=1 Tax=Kwoniella heveanensis BCC8398 TaxID=1296120 RepID=A0A1B9GXL2_9TREE|nr:hypothetical protein I316_02269 [Kwoniella heveanensis BCC8398]